MLNTLGLVPALETQTNKIHMHPPPPPSTPLDYEHPGDQADRALEGKGDALNTDPGTPLGAEILTTLTLMLGKSL